jgi:hypothetical protein
MTSKLGALQNHRRIAAVTKTLRDAAAGKQVSRAQINNAQNLCAELLGKINSRRPQRKIYCGGRVPPAVEA